MSGAMSDERFDLELRRFLDWRAGQLAGVAGPEEIANRIAVRVSAGRPGRAQMMRLAWVMLLAALLAAALAVAALVASRGPDAGELVRLSQEIHRDPPAFSMTTTFGPLGAMEPQGGQALDVVEGWYTACGNLASAEDAPWIRWRYFYDGQGRFRQECQTPTMTSDTGAATYGYVGGFEVRDAETRGVWDAASWQLRPPNRAVGVPAATILWLNWVNVGTYRHPTEGQLVECPTWELGQIETVAGRPARVVSCGADRYWIDEASHLLVKRGAGDEVLIEALELQVGTAPPDAQFDMYPTDFTPRLTVGRAAVDVTLPLIGGGSWDSASLMGRPAAVLIQTDCHAPAVCLSLDDFVAVVTARSDRLNAAAISASHAQAYPAEAVRAAMAAGIPVAVDDQTGWPRWESPGLGTVLFEADGRVAAVVDARSPESLTAAVDALIATSPIPIPPPGDGVLMAGQPAPGIRAQQMGGETFDLSEMRGRPVILLSPPAGWSASPDPDTARLVAELARARDSVGDAAAYVVLAWRYASFERRPGPFDGWGEVLDDARAEAGPSIDGLLLIDPPDPMRDWFQSRVEPYYAQRPAFVVIDADGLVHEVFGGEEIPTAEELAAVLRSLLEPA
jgi:YD repeat-containing protein